MMKWFGPPERASPTDWLERIAIPVGSRCGWCDEPITEQDSGITNVLVGTCDLPTEIVYHDECDARKILGSVAHQQGRCCCTVPGSKCNDDPELTRREAARQALAYYTRRMPFR
jgi:hypothetical protein